MTDTAPTSRDAQTVREIELEADAARASVPTYLRSKDRTAPAGSTHLAFSHRPATPDPRRTRS